MDDFGAAFTGQATTDPATASSQWDAWMERPGNRQALLQMGLQMMQPVAIGQTAGGHIAQSIGAGGEAYTRNALMDEKSALADAKLAQADEKLRITQQNADSSAIRATASAAGKTAKKIGGLTDAFRANAARRDAAAFERLLDRDAAAIEKQAANEALTDPNSEIAKKYKGMTRMQIREALRAERPKPKFGAVPGMDDDDDDDDDTEASAAAPPVEEKPPYPGARKAADGNWYVQKDGKTFRVKM